MLQEIHKEVDCIEEPENQRGGIGEETRVKLRYHLPEVWARVKTWS